MPVFVAIISFEMKLSMLPQKGHGFSSGLDIGNLPLAYIDDVVAKRRRNPRPIALAVYFLET